MKLEGKFAAVTGGTAGIGRAIVEAYLEEGATVAMMARNADKAQKMMDEVGVGDRLIFIKGDATSQSDIEGFIDQAAEKMGQIDILVNNAGGAGDLQPIVNLSDEEFDKTMKWNVYSTFWATRRALPAMIERKWGRVIVISSTEGKQGQPVMTAYTTAKHAVNGMVKAVAQEVGVDGVTVNSICPGLVITDIVKENGPRTAETMGMTLDEMIDMFAQNTATKKPNEAEHVAAVAVLMASDSGGSITGAIYSVDGGTTQY